ncbi:mucosa-associated lymphoid tissue lymphoma translocation protein 1-like [Stylophora pistillata]|uniref:Mucosa-associated lymphoid tissue lymphoma translocation protein 1 n=1 Tax=Stylophora pistillata TaxID=50429 RepID=A0A2B4SAL5_STYPI|nr:mucosa-associated lymphoid tissue lymphoma translocation protein 1-like [Stylophora pistillata]XP_022787099.1 mucosa-associated lymphoid tissue lymphoma translocation protein 1-like [Stylophora pistillata]PFX27714.1 Mucosa-associated lymphoid tissue lymphoma translocation protein 1 [Stylophora pistillata]
MDSRCITDLPDDRKKQIAVILDSSELPNWRSLVQDVIRHHIPSYKDPRQVYAIGMATLSPGGSPTLKLLHDLGQLHITVGEFKSWIGSKSEGAPRLQKVVSLLTLSPTVTQDVETEIRGIPGQNVYIHCEASGHQPLHYQWFKKRELLQGKTENTLQFKSASESDGGYYTCRIANCYGFVFTKWTKLIINADDSVHGYSPFDLPIITSQSDPDVHILVGSRLSLYCDGVGRPAPSYEWFHNGSPIQDAKHRWLIKDSVSAEDHGFYYCRVYNNAGEVHSHHFKVTIESFQVAFDSVPPGVGRDPHPRGPSDRVANKVALLIGNKDYRHQQLGKLFHPINDVCDFTGRLINMGFKVVSLVNLTLEEMRKALVEFCRLLVEDTYAVFYFAGHGFERGGLSYLMPVDASHSYRCQENMASAKVLKAMQETKAKLKLVLLDCCRTEPDYEPQNSPLLSGDLQDIKEPNVVVAFGCCPRSSVFECEQEKNGFFAKHLLKAISDEHRNKSVEEVLLHVSRGIHEENLVDYLTNQKQIVNRITTSVKPMSLWTPVDNTSLNPSAEAATAKWQSAHEIPNDPVTVYQDDKVRVELIFNAEVSNVLIVNARALGEDNLDLNVTFDMSNVTSGCCVARGDMFGKKCRPSEATLKVKDLQRLTEPLVFKLTCIYTLNGERQQKSISYTMEEKPLYAKLVTHW